MGLEDVLFMNLLDKFRSYLSKPYMPREVAIA